ncbi:unnamed protein product [Prorocentrum cordatum]|uniref:Protein kinase domain-containing protein n=1 Tax=Prorocentrum cordatum TaxID=2364126 RepID=A0ABN9V482_9DINO|nr:unnamed protein product [Polarella glacialis]
MASARALDVRDLDVVVADAEDIIRAAAVSSLKRFGFQASHVHEAENGDEALQRVLSMQDSAGCRSPVIVLLNMADSARSIVALFRGGQLLREPFLVNASSNRTQHADHHRLFHCSVPKTFESEKLRQVFEQCQSWWSQGGGEPGRVELESPQRQRSVSEMLAATALKFGTSKHLKDATPPKRASSAKRSAVSDAATTYASEAWKGRSLDSLPVIDFFDEGKAGKPTGGNTVESLDSLLPPRPPFEDVRMICLVGRGSFGRVYRARWDASTVALKVVEHYQQEAPTLMAFEGALSASLAHPNLVQTFKYSIRDATSRGSTEGGALRASEVWIVQEWCGLGTLSQKISKKEIVERGGFSEVVEVCAEISSAASYLHSRGIIHGDLTACNVLLVERRCPKQYVAKITDFGLARVLDNGASKINTATMGTVTYMPPELFQLEGSALTKKVDVYAFGVITWQLCTSGTPFEGLQPTQVVVMVAQGATLELPQGVPTELARVYRQCVSRNPESRPAFERVVQMLLAILSLDAPGSGGSKALQETFA